MLPHTFIALCNTLKENGFLRSSRYVKITEQVAVFILTMAQNHSQRATADRLQRSTWTISTYLRRSCRALCKLGKRIIQPCPTEMPHPVITGNRKYDPWFTLQSCIGAIDGTNISARVPKGNTRYRGRKSTNTQNVMCVVDWTCALHMSILVGRGARMTLVSLLCALMTRSFDFQHLSKIIIMWWMPDTVALRGSSPRTDANDTICNNFGIQAHQLCQRAV
ncbi:hypothetical protein SLA2020_389390 [Shorea laevis]